jgi:enoyl-CoA hydratase
MADYETLEVAREGALVWCTFNRPERFNAMSPGLVDDLHALLDRLRTDREARVLLLRGAGKHFCAGLDLKESGGGEGGPGRVSAGLRGQSHISELAIKLHGLPQPVISLVHGAASGGGFALALASDVRIAADSMRMNAAFIRIGLSACDVGVSYFLPRIVGLSLASELMLTGNFIDAERALATGLVSRVVPQDQLESAGRELALAMVRNSPLGLRLTKEGLRHAVDASSLEAAVAIEDRNQILCSQSPDVAEGVRAFLQKREPEYSDA